MELLIAYLVMYGILGLMFMGSLGLIAACIAGSQVPQKQLVADEYYQLGMAEVELFLNPYKDEDEEEQKQLVSISSAPPMSAELKTALERWERINSYGS